MDKLLLIFIGAGTGGVLRYWVSTTMYHGFKDGFPIGTLVVNVSGSFVMGLLFVLLLDRFADYGSSLRALLLIGFLGGYTTFSSFSIETLNLFENGEVAAGLANILLSFVLCLFATWMGVLLGRLV